MATPNQGKDSTPPPLLLMPASEGLTLNLAQGTSLLLPVPQTEPALIFPEDGEADSFIGQGPNMEEQTPFSCFQQQPPGGTTEGPFTHTSTSAPSMPGGNPMPPHMKAPQMGSTPNPGATPLNFHRPPGPHRYAQPPPGTYAGMSGRTLPPAPPGGTQMAPPTAIVAPSQAGAPSGPIAASTPEMFSGMQSVLPSSGVVPLSYTPVTHHWFYAQFIELRQCWKPFSLADSSRLEDAFRAGPGHNPMVSTDGGRYDVDLQRRIKSAVFWTEPEVRVRRTSWFYRPESDPRFLPYDEEFSEKLEEEYKNAVMTNTWHRRLEFTGGETIVMHNPNVILHFLPTSQPDEWGTAQGEQARPRVVKRGIEEFDNIPTGEPSKIDHLVFVVHGVGSTCDLRFRNLIECVDDFRGISYQLLQSHFKQYQDEGVIGRVEFLPVRWHAALHGDATGIDNKLKAITLPSIGKLRNFTNHTLLDVLFYSSPTYAQQIADTVVDEMNRLYALFMTRNPSYQGNISVVGHSLGSLILFDLLVHQRDPASKADNSTDDTGVATSSSYHSDVATATVSDSTLVTQPSEGAIGHVEDVKSKSSVGTEEEALSVILGRLGLADYEETFQKEQIDTEALTMCEEADLREMGIPMGPRKKLLGFLREREEKQRRSEMETMMEQERRMVEERRRDVEEQDKQATSAAKQVMTRDPLLQSASSTSVDYIIGAAGTGGPLVRYHQLDFCPLHLFALGSPISMFLTVRGVDTLGENFSLPSCPGIFNIFHPFDPVKLLTYMLLLLTCVSRDSVDRQAYRIEPMVTPNYPPKPMLIPHHKGRKRLHLELRESLSRVGSDLKQRIVDSVRSTWKTINEFALAHKTTPQELVDKQVNDVLCQMTAAEQDRQDESASSASSVMDEEEIPIGNLNQGGRRLDYVLQEAPIESFNDYLFALGSHMCYWESEDTLLLILKEVYGYMGISPIKPGQLNTSNPAGQQFNSPQPPTRSPAQNPSMYPPSAYSTPSPGEVTAPVGRYGTPPRMTQPHTPRPVNVGPPPLSGFVKTPNK